MSSRILFCVLVFIVGFGGSQIACAQSYPFPQNRFASQVARPNHLALTQQNSELLAYYQKWKTDFLRQSNGVTQGGGYYITMQGTGGSGTEITTSEAMGYGMIIMALVAGAEPNAKSYFDGMYNMFKVHRSQINPNLMSWTIDSTELTSKDSTSATDGDMDAAYALLIADKQWGSAGTINYLAEARRIIQSGILAGAVNTSNMRLMLGDWWNANWATASRPSDWMTGHMLAFQRVTGDGNWLSLRNNAYMMMQTLQTTYAPLTGLFPDFVSGANVAPAAANFLEGQHDGHYDYNACRVPLRLALDFAHNSNPQAQATLAKMMSFFQMQSGGDPARLASGYKLDGTIYGNWQDSAFIGPIIAGMSISTNYQTTLNRGWDYLKAHHDNYYADTLSLLSMLYLTGNWWDPTASLATPTPTPAPTPLPTPTPAPSANLLNNAGFESGFAGWDNWGGTTLLASGGQQRSGSYALRVSGRAGGRGEEIMAKLKIGSTYKVSAYARLGVATEKAWLGIQFINSSGQIIKDTAVQIKATSYTQYSVSTSVPVGAVKAWVYFWKGSGALSYADVDDFVVSPP